MFLAQQGKCPICRADIVINHKVDKLLDRAVLKVYQELKKDKYQELNHFQLKNQEILPITHQLKVEKEIV